MRSSLACMSIILYVVDSCTSSFRSPRRERNSINQTVHFDGVPRTPRASLISELNRSYRTLPSMRESEQVVSPKKPMMSTREFIQKVDRTIHERTSYEKIESLLTFECMIEREISRRIKSPLRHEKEEKAKLVLLSDCLKRITHYFDTKSQETAVYFGGFKRANSIDDSESFRSITDLIGED